MTERVPVVFWCVIDEGYFISRISVRKMMINILLAIGFLVVASPAHTENYSILGGGANFWWNTHNTDELEGGSEPGYLAYFAIGRAYDKGYRAEIELSYRRNNVHGINDPDNDFKSTGDGNIISGIGLFVNIAYDFSAGNYFTPYLMAGPGMLYLSAKDDDGAENPLNDETMTYGLQVGGGLRFLIKDNVLGGIGLRHMFTLSTDLDGLNTEYDTTALVISLVMNI